MNSAILTTENLTLISSAASGVLVIWSLFYFYYRARSTFFLRDRLWKLIGGKSEFHTPTFEASRKEARELEHFRMEFRVPAESLKEAQAYLKWQSRINIPARKIAFVHNHFDWSNFSNPKVKTKKIQSKIKLFSIPTIALIALCSLSFMIPTSPYVLASLPETPSFYIEKYSFKFTLLGENFNKHTCEDDALLKRESEASKFPIETATEICKTIKDGSAKETIDKLFKEQIAAGIVIFIVCSIYLSMLLYHLRKLYTIRDVKAKIKKHKKHLKRLSKKTEYAPTS